jgi:hypothetical protein
MPDALTVLVRHSIGDLLKLKLCLRELVTVEDPMRCLLDLDAVDAPGQCRDDTLHIVVCYSEPVVGATLRAP